MYTLLLVDDEEDVIEVIGEKGIMGADWFSCGRTCGKWLQGA